mmetsp:Transcript_55554/g.88567  ORF Transcript_55554/g.88567 Transcript_55554/m.88567 type:complete len:233 (-) Transcript_55554:216-914(-)
MLSSLFLAAVLLVPLQAQTECYYVAGSQVCAPQDMTTGQHCCENDMQFQEVRDTCVIILVLYIFAMIMVLIYGCIFLTCGRKKSDDDEKKKGCCGSVITLWSIRVVEIVVQVIAIAMLVSNQDVFGELVDHNCFNMKMLPTVVGVNDEIGSILLGGVVQVIVDIVGFLYQCMCATKCGRNAESEPCGAVLLDVLGIVGLRFIAMWSLGSAITSLNESWTETDAWCYSPYQST